MKIAIYTDLFEPITVADLDVDENDLKFERFGVSFKLPTNVSARVSVEVHKIQCLGIVRPAIIICDKWLCDSLQSHKISLSANSFSKLAQSFRKALTKEIRSRGQS